MAGTDQKEPEATQNCHEQGKGFTIQLRTFICTPWPLGLLAILSGRREGSDSDGRSFRPKTTTRVLVAANVYDLGTIQAGAVGGKRA